MNLRISDYPVTGMVIKDIGEVPEDHFCIIRYLKIYKIHKMTYEFDIYN